MVSNIYLGLIPVGVFNGYVHKLLGEVFCTPQSMHSREDQPHGSPRTMKQKLYCLDIASFSLQVTKEPPCTFKLPRHLYAVFRLPVWKFH